VSTGRRQKLSETVALGQDGFIYHRFERTFDQVCGDVILEGRALERWVSLIEARHAWCAARGLPYILFITPEKHSVYADKLPFGQVSPDRPVRAIQHNLAPAVRSSYIYPLEELIQARATEETFYRTDVHWTSWGAYIGYKALLASISRTHPMTALPQEALLRSRRSFVGNLGIRLDEDVEEEVTDVRPPDTSFVKVFGNSAYTVGQVEIYETPDSTGPRAVLFRDSNATAMLPFLAGHFSRLVLVAGAAFYHEVVRKEKPDIVITQTTERQLARPATGDREMPLVFPGDFEPPGFSDVSGSQLPLPSSADVLMVKFSAGGDSAKFRGEGWSWQESMHVWMVGQESRLTLPIALRGQEHTLEIELIPYISPPQVTAQRYQIRIGDRVLAQGEIRKPQAVMATIPGELALAPGIEIIIHHPDAAAPSATGRSNDSRELSFRVSELRLRTSLKSAAVFQAAGAAA
jgi:hypothetical protein